MEAEIDLIMLGAAQAFFWGYLASGGGFRLYAAGASDIGGGLRETWT